MSSSDQTPSPLPAPCVKSRAEKWLFPVAEDLVISTVFDAQEINWVDTSLNEEQRVSFGLLP